MKSKLSGSLFFLAAIALTFIFAQNTWAQAKGHASVALGRGEEGYLALQEMIKRIEFSLKMSDASPEMKAHLNTSLKHAREAIIHYDEALKHTNQSLGRAARNPFAGAPEGSHMEGSHQAPPPQRSMPEGSHNDPGYGFGGPPMGMPEGSH